MKGSPAIVSTAERVGPPVGATVNVTVPGPVVELSPEVIRTQSALLEAAHVHPAPVVTATVPAPPSDPVWNVVGARL